MFAARTSLLPTLADGGEVGTGGSNDLALELNRIYADPMPTIRKHSAIPGVGASGRSNSADQQPTSAPLVLVNTNSTTPNTVTTSINNNKIVSIEKGEDFPLLPVDSTNVNAKSAISHRQSAGGGGGSGPKSPPFSPKSGTTSGFEDDRLNTKYKLGWRRTLHNKRRQVADYSTVVAIIGIAVMVLETELSMANICQKTEFCSIFLKSFVSLSTIILIGLLLYYHYIEIEIFKVDNSVDDWRIAVSPLRVIRVLCEIAICVVHPLPIDWNIKMYAISDSAVKEVRVSLDVVLGVPMFLRLYLLARLLLLHSRLFTDASSRSIGALNRITFNARFVLKTLMTMCPGTVLMTFILTMFIIGSWILRICETAHNPAYYNLLNSMWLVSITFLAVGYGDFAPETYCGRTVAVFSGFMGAGCTALVVAVVARKLELTRSEKHVHNFMMNTQLSKRLKDSAANVLRETWLIFKYSKLVPRPSGGKIREHQRKFLAAIKNLRKVKLEQRKIAEQCHNLVDFPKVLMGISDAVVDVRSVTVDSVSLIQQRMESIEKDVLEVKAHLLSMQSGLLQMMSDFREATAASQVSQQLQLQLLQLRAVNPQQAFGDFSSPTMDVVPSTAVLVSPPDCQGFSNPNLPGMPQLTAASPKYGDQNWLRCQIGGARGKQQGQGSQDDSQDSSLWSHGGSAQTVIQYTPGQPAVVRGQVPRATSAMEAVASYDVACGGEPSSSHLPHHLHSHHSTDNIKPHQIPGFSSAGNVSGDSMPSPIVPMSTLQTETKQREAPSPQQPQPPLTSATSGSSSISSVSASTSSTPAKFSSSTGGLSLELSPKESLSEQGSSDFATAKAPLAKRSESKL